MDGKNCMLRTGDWSSCMRQGLFWPYHTSFSEGGRSVKGSNRGLFFGRVKASFGLNILVLVKGGGQSRGQTAVSFGRVKASFGLRALVLVQRGGQSSGQTAVSF